ncbi:MAG: hypothetical protein PSV16_00735 [Flavobacterium sp.]|nr:hypothetical protein [Flavobacterium sp.]
MIEIILRNLAYTFYPVNICAMNERSKYMNTFEFKNLIGNINSAFADIENDGLSLQILNTFKSHEILKNIEEATLESSDRCITYKISFFEEEVLFQFYINMSILIPYYYVYVLKNTFESKPYRWITSPQRDRQVEIEKFSLHIEMTRNILDAFNYNRFPDELVTKVIPDINYADVEMGKFTYFNAFFLDDVRL